MREEIEEKMLDKNVRKKFKRNREQKRESRDNTLQKETKIWNWEKKVRKKRGKKMREE